MNMSAPNTIVEPALAWVPDTWSLTPNTNRSSCAPPSTTARSALSLIAQGRSPGAYGFSTARTAALRSSPRAARGAAATTGGRSWRPRLRLRWPNPDPAPIERRPQLARRQLGVGCLGQRTHDGDPARPRL